MEREVMSNEQLAAEKARLINEMSLFIVSVDPWLKLCGIDKVENEEAVLHTALTQYNLNKVRVTHAEWFIKDFKPSLLNWLTLRSENPESYWANALMFQMKGKEYPEIEKLDTLSRRIAQVWKSKHNLFKVKNVQQAKEEPTKASSGDRGVTEECPGTEAKDGLPTT